MTEPEAPWWADVREASRLVASSLGAAAARAGRDGVYRPPPGRPEPRRRRRPASLRHLAEVITTNRLAPGLSMDKDIVGAVLAGDPRYIANPTAVVAVARASHLIARLPFDEAEAQRLTVASARVAALVERARQADEDAPGRLPAPAGGSAVAQEEKPPETAGPGARAAELRHDGAEREPVVLDGYFTTRTGRSRRRRALIAAAALAVVAAGAGAYAVLRDQPDRECHQGAVAGEIIDDTPAVFQDDDATRLSPTLDYDEMNGSARYARRDGKTYYWGRAGSDDKTPRSGGTRVRWRVAGGPWHSCATALPVTDRGYVHSPAVPTTIGGRAVTLQVCLWRDDPGRREACTPEIATG